MTSEPSQPENPFQSPLSLQPCARTPAERRGRAAWFMIPVGLFVGSLVIGFFGAVGAGLLFLVASQSEVLFAAAIGGIFGIVGGALLGAVAGLGCSLTPPAGRRVFVWLVTMGAGIYGAAVGVLGGTALRFGTTSDLWMAMGAFIGGASGVAGGFLLARLLASVGWSKALD